MNTYSSLKSQFKCHLLHEALSEFTYSRQQGILCSDFPLTTCSGSQSASYVEEKLFFDIALFPEITVSTITIKNKQTEKHTQKTITIECFLLLLRTWHTSQLFDLARKHMPVVDASGALPCRRVHCDIGGIWDPLLVGFLWPQEDAHPGLFRADQECQSLNIPAAAIHQ